METLGHRYIDTRMRMHAPDLRTHASCMRTHVRVLETIKDKFFYIKTEVWNKSHIV